MFCFCVLFGQTVIFVNATMIKIAAIHLVNLLFNLSLPLPDFLLIQFFFYLKYVFLCNYFVLLSFFLNIWIFSRIMLFISHHICLHVRFMFYLQYFDFIPLCIYSNCRLFASGIDIINFFVWNDFYKYWKKIMVNFIFLYNRTLYTL